MARFVTDALVKWAIIPVGESHDDFWQKADPAPRQTNQDARPHARFHATNKLSLIMAGSRSAGNRRRRRRAELQEG